MKVGGVYKGKDFFWKDVAVAVLDVAELLAVGHTKIVRVTALSDRGSIEELLGSAMSTLDDVWEEIG